MDPKHLTLGRRKVAPKANNRPGPPRHNPGEKFLKGPVPLSWLFRAGQLPGKALHTGIALWFLANMRHTSTVALPNGLLKSLGVDRYAKYRALHCLEQSGLIKCDRHAGRSPIVTLLAVGAANEAA